MTTALLVLTFVGWALAGFLYQRCQTAEAESAYDRAMLARVSEWAKHVRRDVAAQRQAQTPIIDPDVWTRVLDDVPEGER